MDIEEIATNIVKAAIKVHTALGPGLLESAYQKCMEYELKKNGVAVACETVLPITYESISIDAGPIADLPQDEEMQDGISVELERPANERWY
jgi:GxxExxY protein